MPVRRTKSIGTKVTDEEYARFEALAGGQRLSEWVRDVLLKATSPPTDVLLLAELLALRTILLNLHFSMCRGVPVTTESMQGLIAHADAAKQQLAEARLTGADGRAR